MQLYDEVAADLLNLTTPDMRVYVLCYEVVKRLC